jgi:hypothetical protein
MGQPDDAHQRRQPPKRAVQLKLASGALGLTIVDLGSNTLAADTGYRGQPRQLR